MTENEHIAPAYIIPFRYTEERYRNLEILLKWLQESYIHLDIIVVEHDTNTHITPLLGNYTFQHVFVHAASDEVLFNRSLCFNRGAKYCYSDRLIFADGDIIIDHDQLKNAISLLSSYDCVSPYNRVIDLSEEETNNFSPDTFTINKSSRGENDGECICFAGGIVLFNRWAFEYVAGWEEVFEGWGAEDDNMSDKITIMKLNSIETPYNCYHLYHGRGNRNRKQYKKNWETHTKFNNYSPEEWRNHINFVRRFVI